ncbi:ComF family protein [Paenibacillus polymyxa]|uniref:ComF family protein n=1 Tax=Paenibacillus polymyxa TaxID=1406 RepID=UPI001E412A9E|nr:ComF family protein [Paenibacillus polymyxa]
MLVRKLPGKVHFGMGMIPRTRLFLNWLFHRQSQTCVACGKLAGHFSEFTGLCTHCSIQIPWIYNIRCVHCGRPTFCPDCVRPDRLARYYICNRSAISYTPMVREWIGQFKYRGNEKFGPLLGEVMNRAYQAMRHEFADHDSTRFKRSLWDVDIVTCVPVSEKRLTERGFNQAQILAEKIAKQNKLPFLSLLVRPQDTGKQSFKSKNERMNTMNNAFSVIPNMVSLMDSFILKAGSQRAMEHMHSVTILLVDDIYTTGSTLQACARVLREMALEQGVHLAIFCLTFARS